MPPPALEAAAADVNHAAILSLLRAFAPILPPYSPVVAAAASSPNAAVNHAGPEEQRLQDLLLRTDLRTLQTVSTGATGIKGLMQQIKNAGEWWEKMEAVYDDYLTAEEQQQVMQTVQVDALYTAQGWLDAQLFTQALRGATDLAAFLVACHPDNAPTAAALREALTASPYRSRSMRELEAEARFFHLRDSWLAFKQRPTVFHASRFYSNWQQLRLRSLREELEGGSPISGPLTAGGLYCLQRAVPVCRRILASRIDAGRQRRERLMQPLHIHNHRGIVQIGSPHAAAELNGDVHVSSAQWSGLSSPSSAQHGEHPSAPSPLRSESSPAREVLQNADFDTSLTGASFICRLQRVMRSVVKLSRLLHVDAYAAGFDPNQINHVSIPNYRADDEAAASAFLISPSLLLTNHHVLPTAAAAAYSPTRVCFDDDGPDAASPCCYGELRPADFFFTDRELDITVVAFVYPHDEYVDAAAAQPELKHPKRREPLLLRYDSVPHDIRDLRLLVVGHPEQQVKQLSMKGERDPAAVVLNNPYVAAGVASNQYLLYTNDTRDGSSGSPVLDVHGQLLGVHYGWVNVVGGRRNVGTVASAVFHRLLAQYDSCSGSAAQTPQSRRAMELLRDCLGRDERLPIELKNRLML